MRQLFLIILLTVLTNGCVPRYFQKGIFRKKVVNSYTNEPLVYGNYVLCNIIGRQGHGNELTSVSTDNDSLLLLLHTAFANNGMDLARLRGDNYCDDALIEARPLRGNDIKKEYAIKLLENHLDGFRLVPVIYIDNHIIFTGSISSAGVTDDSGFLFMPFVTLLIFIFDGNELIYRHMVTHKADALRAPYLDEAHELTSAGTVTQENWDELVRRTMRRYMKRVEK